MKTPFVSVVLVGMLLVLATGCQQKTVLLVSPELSDVTDEIGSYLASHTSTGAWSVSTEGAAWPSDSIVVRLTTTPNANLPPGAGPGVLLPSATVAGEYVTASALLRLARRPEGWDALPLFFDVWGQTRFDPIDLTGTFPLSWDVLVAQAKKSTVVVAGSRPSFRQWALHAGSSDPRFHFTTLAAWFNQTSEDRSEDLQKISQLKGKPFWAESTWNFTMADVRQSYQARSPLVFLETYRDFGTANASGSRRFFPFQIALNDGGVAVGGIVIFAEVRSSNQEAWKAAQPILTVLTSLDFQKELGSKTHWLAANLNVPELDGTGSAVRSLTTQAQAFVPLADRLPHPLVEGNLVVEAQLSADRPLR